MPLMNTIKTCEHMESHEFISLKDAFSRCRAANCEFLTINPFASPTFVTFCPAGFEAESVSREGAISFTLDRSESRKTGRKKPQIATVLAPCGAEGPIVADDHHPVWRPGKSATKFKVTACSRYRRYCGLRSDRTSEGVLADQASNGHITVCAWLCLTAHWNRRTLEPYLDYQVSLRLEL